MCDLIPELRLKSILHYLADATTIVTVKQIADEIGVSRRTILREIPDIENWLKSNQFELVRKPGHGVMIAGDGSTRDRLRRILNENTSEIVNIPKDRQKMLLVELMQQKEPVKLYYFTSKLGVSVSTISNDLDKVEKWLQKYNLILVRKTGLGVYITGEEKDFRRAMISLLYENLSEEELMKIIKDTVPNRLMKNNVLQINVRNRLLNLIDTNSIEKIEKIVYRVEKRLQYRLAESACIGLMVHLALAIQRIKNNEKIMIDETLLDELKKINEFKFASDIVRDIVEEFDVEIPEDEIGYITMHLKGARIYNDTMREGNSVTKQELLQIAAEMIETVEKEFGVELVQNEKLLFDLVSHLDPALHRLELNLDIRNPLLEKLKQLFPEVYKISQKASEVLKKKIQKEIPEPEIGFLAMHFAAAIEKSKVDIKKNYKVAVACPSGIGSSRLLSARIEKEFKEIEIVDVISTHEINEEWVKQNKVNFIVSTIPIEKCPVRNVCVNPLLLEEDKILIHQVMHKGDLKDRKLDVSNTSILHLKNNIANVVDYSNFISEILDNHKIIFDHGIICQEQFASKISEYITEDPDERALIAENIRDKKYSILNDDCIMFNCYSEKAVQHSLILCRLNKEVVLKYSGKNIPALLILIIPKNKQAAGKGIIEDFNYFLSSNQSVKMCFKSVNQSEINEKLYEVLSELYVTKLYEWRAELHS